MKTSSFDAEWELPADLDAVNYCNLGVQRALAQLQENPSYDTLAAFLNSLRSDYLIVDVTGTTTKKHGTRVRTVRATNGKLVLPIFTSMQQLRNAHQAADPKGAIMPALAVLELLRKGRFAAAEFDPAGAKQVVLRKFLEKVLSTEELTAASLGG